MIRSITLCKKRKFILNSLLNNNNNWNSPEIEDDIISISSSIYSCNSIESIQLEDQTEDEIEISNNWNFR